MTSKILKQFAASLALVAAFALPLRADLLELTNGDHYRGTVLSMDASNVIFRSEIQGRVVLPRNKVAVITLNVSAAKPVANVRPASPQTTPPVGALRTNATGVVSGSQSDAVTQELRKQGVNSALIDQVQQQIAGKSSPEATAKFNQLMSGFMSGQLSVDDIRKEAQNSINQINAAKKELGPDGADMFDSYLSILEKFVQDSDSTASTPPAQAPPGK